MVTWKNNLVNAFPNPYMDDKHPPAPPSLVPHLPFPFFKLPSELRNRVYALLLFTSAPYNTNSRTSLFLASRRLHDEASYVLYSFTTFRIFPLQDFGPLPTVRDLPPKYRKLVTTIELVLGPSWTAPPKSWKVNKVMGKVLSGMRSAQTLKVRVEIDPSHEVFAKFRVSHEFYTDFCGGLLKDVLKAMPSLEVVQISGRPSVQMDGPLVSRLQREVEAQGRVLKWGQIGRRISIDDNTATGAVATSGVDLEHSLWSVRNAKPLSQLDQKAPEALPLRENLELV
jgi:hypothetical protein